MTTIRRTLSPVPRPGTLLGGEATSVASPLSKCSSCNQDYTSTTTGYSFLLNLFSKRPLRSFEKQKPKVIIWRRSLFLYFVCFLLGVFLGFTPIVLIKTSPNRDPKNQDYVFEQLRKAQLYDVNFTDIMDRHILDVKQENETVNGVVSRPHIHDLERGFGKFLIIVTTPTYPRMFHRYYLNRLAHTLKLVEAPLLWLVVEMTSQSVETSKLLMRSGVMYRHLVCTKNTTEIRDSRVHQRNVALSHIEKHRLDGIVYFAEDSNVYSTQLFDHIRQIRRLGTWPVAKLKKGTRLATFEGPICNGTQVIGWHTNNVMRRFNRFHSDLSGFAFNSTILWDPVKWGRATLQPIRQLDVKDEFQVSTFIEQVVEDESKMEGIPEDCSKVLVWHLPTKSFDHSQQRSFHTDTNYVLPLSPSF